MARNRLRSEGVKAFCSKTPRLTGNRPQAMYIACGLFPVSLGVFEQKAFTPSERNRFLAIFGACVAVLIVNPYGWRLMWSPLDMMINQKLSVSTIAEWQPLNLSNMEGKGVIVAIAVMVVANCIRGRKWKIYEMAFVFL